jgi:flagellar export protein FliJ
MKRFDWSLQKLLDVTVQRERAQRAELASVNGKIHQVREQIDRRRELIRTLMEDLAAQTLPDRIANHQTFHSFSQACQKEIARLGGIEAELGKEKERITADLLALRSERQTLETLREEAWNQYCAEAQKQQQKELDDTVNTTFARRIMTGN